MRKIIHCDCDCFYASVELRDDPSLKGRPVAVGGAAERRGVVATCNYEARAFGIHSAMPTASALRRCPDLIVLTPRMDKYREVALQIRAIFSRYTEQIEPLSLDEAYLDVSDCDAFQGSATRIAEAIRQQVRDEVGITISAGVAPNKFLAKVASDWDKPDGLTVITPSQVDEFVLSLPVKKIHGVGKVMSARMATEAIFSCADLRQKSLNELLGLFGKFGHQLFDYARGIDERAVKPHRERKSLSVETTFAQDIVGVDAAKSRVAPLLLELETRLLRRGDKKFSGAFVKLKSDDFRQTTIDRRYEGDLTSVLFEQLLEEAWARMASPLRLIGIGVRFASNEESSGGSNSIEGGAEQQLDLFTDIE
ncbi:DNA polymerase IV [Zhongshania aquimaris]|uniref:DNA polymerase IV n=1 Tax=Zhongshania aquimaris TaxID=2857107 RepID=A0ABS6VW60_9GAMM|nr:DNA polymerase IV [Zhongshania aquimaris]MBW2942579.1 DNA polymerase IV [Zhongshania aquimaris]